MPFTTQKPRSAMRTAKRIILGLTFVTVFAGLIAGLVIWRIHATRVTATAIFRVATETPALLADELSQRHEERDYEYFKNSQLAALRSHWLLTAAMRNPGIASLSTFAGIDKPEEWLEEHLEAEYPEDGEYLCISLSGPESQSDDLVLIVDAVAKAYQNEVVYKQKHRRQAHRDEVSRTLEKMNKDIEQKSMELYEILQWIRSVERDGDRILEQHGIIRLDVIEPRKAPSDAEQLEPADQFSNSNGNTPPAESRSLSPGQAFAEYSAQRRELRVLEKIADELSENVKKLDLEVGLPPRIEQVQAALIDE